MEPSAVAIIVAASVLGAFCRAATGFGGSILFVLVYSLASQLHLAPGLESAVLMVVLGTVFEFSTSTVLFLAVTKRARQLWRSLLLLSLPGAPGTALGFYILVQTGENLDILESIKTCLNLTFGLVALFKITVEFRAYAKARQASQVLHVAEVLDEDIDSALCRKMGWQFTLLGFFCGLMNGLMGLAGPLAMVHFSTALSNKRMTANTCYTLTQAFFMVTTVMRLYSLGSPEIREELSSHWRLALVIPLPSLVALVAGWEVRKRFNTTLLLRCVVALLLLSSLMGLGVFKASDLGLWALGVTLFWLLLAVSVSLGMGACLKKHAAEEATGDLSPHSTLESQTFGKRRDGAACAGCDV